MFPPCILHHYLWFLSFFFPVKSSVLVCDISSFPDSEVYVVSESSSLSSFNNILSPGRNGDKSVGFIYLWFFGIHFLVVTFTSVPPVKSDYPVDKDKEDVTEAEYFFGALLLLLALVHLIEKSYVVSVFHLFYLSILKQTAQQTFHTRPCLDLQYYF